MGLIATLIAFFLCILGVGYFYFGMDTKEVTVHNEQSGITGGLARYEETKNAALEIKEILEQKALDTVEEGVEIHQQEKENVQEKKEESGKEASVQIIERLMGSGFEVPKNKRKIDTIVLHSSYDALGKDPYAVAGLIKEYEEYGVSTHYLIDRKGAVYRLVIDENIAYHAGASKMPDGRVDANNFSLGIEIMNTETEQYTKAQHDALRALIAYLKDRHPIAFVVGHKDIAPQRKTDPWNFDWKKLQ
ncbi:MAG: N-acetylmuramoyl-L-alanine amidase [Candidatus Moranbacteria bacterium]|nr:N-acetylmuramoyl-L-alanine amidase [Candidatus Moranbacteria bacterium]